MTQETKFLSCDWGTTAFRLRLVSTNGFKILAEVSSKRGIASVYEEWSKGGKEEAERVAFYQAIILDHLKELEGKAGSTLDELPLIISGMASSNIGMIELPYKPLPYALDGSDLETKAYPASNDFPHPLLIISGVRTEDDVMRGEEVQVVGCGIKPQEKEQLIIHPGTHCKHITVKGDEVTSFTTYMTGELFSLLSTKSILSASVGRGGDFEMNRSHFEAGLREAEQQNLLHAAFMVRTATLFKKRTKEQNFYYLSGLLIGGELASFSKDFSGHITLAGEEALVKQYKAALEFFGVANAESGLSLKEPDFITLAGQYTVYQHQMLPENRV